MQRLLVAVGSTRALKVQAVSEALASFGAWLAPGAEFDVRGIDVPSGVSHTPQSRAESMAGARIRAQALVQMARERAESWAYFVGLEGGIDVVQEDGKRRVFLESWAFVADAAGREAWGHAGGVMLPEALADEILDHGVELSAAIDQFAGAAGIRDAQGAWGVLTRNLITRQDVLRAAVTNAFAPFFNASAYNR
jgi:inosine/xanthosine triphosphatase